MQSCVLFVLSLLIQESTGWGSWNSWSAKKPSPGNGGKRNKCKNPVVPLSKCQLAPGQLTCTVSSYNGYPSTPLEGGEFYRTSWTNMSVLKWVGLSPSEIDYTCTDCLQSKKVEPTLEICAVYDLAQPSEDGSKPCVPAGGTEGVANSCGVHVHAYDPPVKSPVPNGDAVCKYEHIGGHYWNKDSTDEDAADQWAQAMLMPDDVETVSNFDGPKDTFIQVANYYSEKSVKDFNDRYTNRLHVNHNGNGDRVGCCVYTRMPTKKEARDFAVIVPFIAKTGQAKADEDSVIIGKPTAIHINGAGTFVDFWSKLGTYINNNKQCYKGSGKVADPSKANVAGFHIHAGSSCGTSEGQQGHYFKDKDNWQAARYGSGQKVGWGSHIDIGYEWRSIANRVVIIHNGDGARVWCGKLYFTCKKGPWSAGDSSKGDSSKCNSCQAVSQAKGQDYQCLPLVSGDAKYPRPSRNSPTVCCPPDQVASKWGRKYCRDNAFDDMPETKDRVLEDESDDEEESSSMEEDPEREVLV